MASFLYNSTNDDLCRGNINFATDTFWVMLTTSAYTENQDTHTKRSDVTNEITATGYTAGGKVCTVTLAKDTVNNRQVITFTATSWAGFTGTARKAVYYKRRGGAASADELIGINDFGADVTMTAQTFAIADTVYTIQL